MVATAHDVVSIAELQEAARTYYRLLDILLRG
jgi:hypothetical protein